MNDCPEIEAQLDEFALGLLPGDERAAVLDHLEACPACRGIVDVLSEAADELLLAAPQAEPPPGFAEAVLARIHPAHPQHEQAAPRRRRWAAAAAAAVVLVVLGMAVGLRLGRPEGDELRSVDLVSSSGGDAGDVFAYADRPAWFFVRVDRALPRGTYRCVLDLDDASTVPLGTLSVSEGKGAWSWRVTIDARRVRAAELLDTDGKSVAVASFR
jgi:Putative zinc-finger